MKPNKIQLGVLLSLLPLMILLGLRFLSYSEQTQGRPRAYQPPVQPQQIEKKSLTQINREEMHLDPEAQKKQALHQQEEISMSWDKIIGQEERGGMDKEKWKVENDKPQAEELKNVALSLENPKPQNSSSRQKPSNGQELKEPKAQGSPTFQSPEGRREEKQSADAELGLEQKLKRSSLLAKDRYSFISKKKQPRTSSDPRAPKEDQTQTHASQEFYEASVYGAHEIQEGEVVRFELTEPLVSSDIELAQGAILQGITSYYGGRLRVEINTVKTPGGLKQIRLSIHDGVDYQEGISYLLNDQANQLKDQLIDQGVNRIPVVGGAVQTLRNATSPQHPKFKLDGGLRVFIKVR